jgi:hypothetical protein
MVDDSGWSAAGTAYVGLDHFGLLEGNYQASQKAL